jgi:hypothetical protein
MADATDSSQAPIEAGIADLLDVLQGRSRAISAMNATIRRPP